MHELILGGQRSGKSRCAEARASVWSSAPERSAVLVATALAGDAEMRERIAAHRRGRAQRVPAMLLDEVPRELARAVLRHSAPQRMVVVDCLLLWLTNLLMPLHGPPLDEGAWQIEREALCRALASAPGPVLLVSNEVGLGLSPVSAEARRCVDALGDLHQRVAATCGHVTLMVAGLELPVKRSTP